MPAPATVDAVFVGGGVIGLAAAWQAACAGLTTAVVDPLPGHGATWAAAGMLAPATEASYGEEGLVALNLAGAARWPSFASSLENATGLSIDYLRRGTLVVAADGSDRVAVDELLAFQQSLGLEASRLSGRQCREREPSLAAGVRGGAEFPGDHQVDNRRLVAALLVAGQTSGVLLVTGEAVEVRSSPGGRADGVRLRDGSELHAGAVVLTAGCGSSSLAGVPPGVLPPVRPVKGLTLRLRQPSGIPALRTTIRGLVHGHSCYLVPRNDGSAVLGATMEEKGFDRQVQAGPVYELLRDARAIVPALDEYELVETCTGLRPGSPDNAPIVGPTGMPGLLAATGHYRHGILLAPLTADAVVGYLGTEPVPEAMRPFGPDRFPIAQHRDVAASGNQGPGADARALEAS